MNDHNEALAVFATGLKNAHAMEKQALSILKPQVSRIENYPDMRNRIEQHISETEQQIERLETLFDRIDEKHSGFKDMALSMGGTMAALSHAAAGDEVLKDTFANYAFEHYEIAAYKSLIRIGDHLSIADTSDLLRQNLEEEEMMAQWIDEHVGLISDQYLLCARPINRQNDNDHEEWQCSAQVLSPAFPTMPANAAKWWKRNSKCSWATFDRRDGT